jgi:hypothetical protein
MIKHRLDASLSAGPRVNSHALLHICTSVICKLYSVTFSLAEASARESFRSQSHVASRVHQTNLGRVLTTCLATGSYSLASFRLEQAAPLLFFALATSAQSGSSHFLHQCRLFREPDGAASRELPFCLRHLLIPSGRSASCRTAWGCGQGRFCPRYTPTFHRRRH